MQPDKVIVCLVLTACLFWLPGIGAAQDQDEATPDPGAGLTQGRDLGGHSQYTKDQFDALSDDEKREVYHRSPERLPFDFKPAEYSEKLHQKNEIRGDGTRTVSGNSRSKSRFVHTREAPAAAERRP